MASIEDHCMDCLVALGKPYKEVHLWLDEFFAVLGPNHRKVRHHVGGVREAREKWGDEAGKAAELHIRRDCCGKLPTEEEAKNLDIFGPDFIDDKGSEFLTDE